MGDSDGGVVGDSDEAQVGQVPQATKHAARATKSFTTSKTLKHVHPDLGRMSAQ